VPQLGSDGFETDLGQDLLDLDVREVRLAFGRHLGTDLSGCASPTLDQETRGGRGRLRWLTEARTERWLEADRRPTPGASQQQARRRPLLRQLSLSSPPARFVLTGRSGGVALRLRRRQEHNFCLGRERRLRFRTTAQTSASAGRRRRSCCAHCPCATTRMDSAPVPGCPAVEGHRGTFGSCRSSSSRLRTGADAVPKPWPDAFSRSYGRRKRADQT
jgi:hypothetical protein